MSDWISIGDGAVRWLIAANLQAAILIAIVWGVLRLFGDRLSPRWRCVLWLLVAVRLALPAVPPFFLHPARLMGTGGSPPESAVIDLAVATSSSAAAAPARPPESGSPASAASISPAPPSVSFASWRTALALLWLAGCAAFLARLAIASVRLSRAVRRLTEVSDPGVRRALEAAARAMGVRAPPPVVTGPEVAAPALCGWLRPRLVLPDGLWHRLAPAELESVFFHELAHLRRRDVLSSWILAVLEAVHWMNPLVWWAFARLRDETELACDDLALTKGGDPDRYARAVIRVAEAASLGSSRLLRGASPAAGLRGRPRFLARRIGWITGFDRRKPTRHLLPILLLVGIAMVGLTRAPRVEPVLTKTFDIARLIASETFDAGFLQEVRAAAPRKAGGKVTVKGDVLTVRAPSSVLDAAGRLIEGRLAGLGIWVIFEARFIAVSPEAEKNLPAGLQDIAKSLREKDSSPRGREVSAEEVQLLPPSEFAFVMRNHQRICMFNSQETLKIRDRKRGTGFMLEVRPAVSEDRSRILLDFKGTSFARSELRLSSRSATLALRRGVWTVADACRVPESFGGETTFILLVKADLAPDPPVKRKRRRPDPPADWRRGGPGGGSQLLCGKN